MKSFFVVVFVAVVLQCTSAQVIGSIGPSILGNCGCGGVPACGQTILASPSCGCGGIPACGQTILASPSCGCGGIPACGQTIVASPSCGCGPSIIAPPAVPATIIQSNSVAASLADTLSLLTVSSLLADTLPVGGCGYGGLGCGCGYGGLGCGCGYGGLGCGCSGLTNYGCGAGIGPLFY